LSQITGVNNNQNQQDENASKEEPTETIKEIEIKNEISNNNNNSDIPVLTSVFDAKKEPESTIPVEPVIVNINEDKKLGETSDNLTHSCKNIRAMLECADCGSFYHAECGVITNQKLCTNCVSMSNDNNSTNFVSNSVAIVGAEQNDNLN
jgi:hypothetical protein